MKLLVLTQDYPSLDNPYAMAYVHSRNIEYKKLGHIVTVVNFSTKNSYLYEQIEVTPFANDLIDDADIILSHAPNIRNHFKILQKLNAKKIVFFFHGHEVLYRYRDYPPSYCWVKQNPIKKLGLYCYDFLKINLVAYYLEKISRKNQLSTIFVSRWMEKQFIKNIKIDPNCIGRTTIIPNACNPIFLDQQYKFEQENKLADYITIRPLDDSKYAIDLVINFALKNPEKSFHIYGKGKYFDVNDKPKNVTVFNQFIQQKDIPNLLNKYACALMPTRYDSQGVMVCEMATFGIPVITSTFEVCLEMLSTFENVIYLNEDDFSQKFEIKLPNSSVKNMKFSPTNLIAEEISFFDRI
ncbi:glycosyltransferase [Gallibacterium anatis]|uniref:glycosyltransferase n=1 Tax=Gallibacterium anatis TaxID=750 RepID=UPI0022319299|nr:glycosyltransferase [Gallibacterium anatis]UZD16900.1 glycosyltransferase [Gallibacterium anatis]